MDEKEALQPSDKSNYVLEIKIRNSSSIVGHKNPLNAELSVLE